MLNGKSQLAPYTNGGLVGRRSPGVLWKGWKIVEFSLKTKMVGWNFFHVMWEIHRFYSWSRVPASLCLLEDEGPPSCKLRQVRFAMDWKLTAHAGSGAFSLPDRNLPHEIGREKKGPLYGCFQKSPNHPFYWVFHYKPSVLGYPYFWKHPYPTRQS